VTFDYMYIDSTVGPWPNMLNFQVWSTQDDTGYVDVRIAQTGNKLYSYDGISWNYFKTINVTKWYGIKIVCSGDNYEIFIEEQEVETLVDSGIRLSGESPVQVGPLGDYTPVSRGWGLWDNIKISLLDPSIDLSVKENETALLLSDSHLLTDDYQWFSTPEFSSPGGTWMNFIAEDPQHTEEHETVYVDRVFLVRMDNINVPRTDPLDPDTDGDNITDGNESVINAYWWEAEDFADSAQILDTTDASNSKEIAPRLDLSLCTISEPNYTYPMGNYTVYLRPKGGPADTIVLEVTHNVSVTVDLVTMSARYEWRTWDNFVKAYFTLDYPGTISVNIYASTNFVRLDKVLLIQGKFTPIRGEVFGESITEFSGSKPERIGLIAQNASGGILMNATGVPVQPDYHDSDGDGVSDDFELRIGGTSPVDRDSDNDGILDIDEVSTGDYFKPYMKEAFFTVANNIVDPLDMDTDRDWLNDSNEINEIGSNPFDVDTDDDILSDGWEIRHGLNPLSDDSDSDKLLDPVDMTLADWAALDDDVDNDGILDGNEDVNYNGKLDEGETDRDNFDTDGDGLWDGQEVGLAEPEAVHSWSMIFRPWDFIPDEDAGLTRSDPTKVDTDGDGLWDGKDAGGNGEDLDLDGAVDNGGLWPGAETDPSRWSTDGDPRGDKDENNAFPNFNSRNYEPEAHAGGDRIVNEGSTVHFYGSVTDPDATSMKYEWDFAYEVGPFINMSGAQNPTYKWDDEHEAVVALRVTDNWGVQDIDTANVSVRNVPPSVDAGSDKVAFTKRAVSFSGTASDPGIYDTLTYKWEFGDGGTASGTLTPSHEYLDDGTYTVNLTVDDGDGGVGKDTLTVTVKNQPPEVSFTYTPSTFIEKGDSITFDGTSSSDPDGTIISYHWNFGDGPTYYESAEDYPDGAFDGKTVHSFSSGGTYIVYLTVEDDDGDKNDTYKMVKVSLPPSLINGKVDPTTGDHLEAYTFTVTYVESDELAPNSAKVLIDGTAYAMTEVDTNDNTYGDGKDYSFSTRLSTIPAYERETEHTYQFKFTSWEGNPITTTEKDGPTVQWGDTDNDGLDDGQEKYGVFADNDADKWNSPSPLSPGGSISNRGEIIWYYNPTGGIWDETKVFVREEHNGAYQETNEMDWKFAEDDTKDLSGSRYKWMTGDLNGNGEDEIIWYYNPTDAGWVGRKVFVREGYTNAHSDTQRLDWIYVDNDVVDVSSSSVKWMTGDLDGDGTDEIIWYYNGGGDYKGMKIFVREEHNGAYQETKQLDWIYV
ncbi:MAG: PKD domain-containing protein, partial [Thermoplasmata archaeon]|nr:PKD domain-containing protein [Thermoplasmata archaeon]